jgi:predicted RNA-binding protein with PIN domain
VEPVTIVDAENVRRSLWPNIGRQEILELVHTWADATGADVLLVFDGDAPAGYEDSPVTVVGSKRESADDRIVRDAKQLARAGRPYRLVTSDRLLRDRAGDAAQALVGGGSFARTLRSL